MKKILALALLLPALAAAQSHDKACGVFVKINNVLQKAHLKPKPIDDSLSVYVFEAVMQELDDSRTLFLQKDYDLLAKHKYKIDDYLKNRDCSFFSDFISVYTAAIGQNKNFIDEIARQGIVYNTKDTMYYSRTSFPYHTEPEKIKAFLQKRIAYEILEDIAKQGTSKDSLLLHIDDMGAVSKSKIIEAYRCRINSLLSPSEGFDNNIYNIFFAAFCSYFDPHSTYFNYNEKASFMSSIATENYSLGLYVRQNEKEEIIVEDVVPGGPAYKTNKIDKGDQLLKLAANDREYPVTCSSLEAISNIVLSDSYRTVELTLRKNDGTVYSVNLEKKIMKAESHSVYSFIINGESKTGYIKIPSFYTALDDSSGSGSADDVANEIRKLKEEGIEGLIIDLQYNGGGSMEEVIKMASLFVDSGPIGIIAAKGKSYEVIKDYYRGTLYSGPMVVLVNSFSASASEFFAGVMQDYNRGVIAGGTTLGKATMQTIVPVTGSGQDFVKVTIDKFYRITGKSSQYNGVEPDIKMPVFFEKLLPRENTMPMAIKNDSIKIRLKLKPLPDANIKRAVALSRSRIAANDDFKRIDEINRKIDALYEEEDKELPVTFDSVFTDVHAMDDIWKDINAATEKEYPLQVAVSRYYNAQDDSDDLVTYAGRQKIKALKTDGYVYEAVNIIRDLCNYAKGN